MTALNDQVESVYPPTSIGGMFPKAAELMEGLLAERNGLERQVGALSERIEEARRACGVAPPPGLTLDQAVGWVRALRFIDALLLPPVDAVAGGNT